MDRNNQLANKREIAPDSSDATILVNRFGNISYANGQAQEQFGYSEQELQGRAWRNCFLRSLCLKQKRAKWFTSMDSTVMVVYFPFFTELILSSWQKKAFI